VILIGHKAEVKHDPTVNLEKLPVSLIEAPDLDEFEKVKEMLSGADLIIDALFGIGLNKELTSPYFEIVTYINSLGKAVLAVDLPSGLNATTGEVMGAAIKATETITFAAAKTGFYRGAGPLYTGKITVVDIGIPFS
jgi:NAD(P)H-hydrate epimerase